MISLQEYLTHERNYDGYCTACGEWTTGGVEPDAEGYACENPECAQPDTVIGAETAFITDAVEIEGD